MLNDHDDRKWEYPPHTAAKHKLLIRYMKAWLPILGSGARRAGHGAQLVIVDAFAGRGRYTNAAPGSPLILRDIAGRVISDSRVDEVELYYIERDAENARRLEEELRDAERTPGVIERGPLRESFEQVAPAIVRGIANSRRSSFWFIDPFGFAGVSLSVIREVLRPARAEVFITLMARDINRFLDQPNHQQAIARLLDLTGEALALAIDRVKEGPHRIERFLALYRERLKARGGARFVWAFRIAEDGPADTIYYLVHGSNHVKGLREMKEAAHQVSGGTFAFSGPSDPQATGQLGLFGGDVGALVNLQQLKDILRQRFGAREVEYEALQNEIHPEPELDDFIDEHVRLALEQLTAEGVVAKFREGVRSSRQLRKGDKLRFAPN